MLDVAIFRQRRGEALGQFFLVGYVEERQWWPIQSPSNGRK